MPPKRQAENENGSNNNELRRSTRGGGHKAPEPKPVKPVSVSNPKKAKTDGAANGNSNGEEITATTTESEAAPAPASTNGNADEKSIAAAPGDSLVKQAEQDAKKEGVALPEENKAIASSNGKKRIEVGEQLPEGIVLKNDKDQDVTISDITKDKGAVFFVYPKANTPGCTTQACLFRDHYAEFAPLGYEVYGLSSDSPKAQASWKEKNSFQYDFLCDPGQILLTLLGASKGPKSNQRSHYIVEKGGKLVDAKYTVSPKDSVNLALEFIKKSQQ